MSTKTYVTIAAVVILAIIAGIIIIGTAERNDAQNWQMVQSVRGKTRIKDTPGWYVKMFAKVWTYPRYMEFRYNDDPTEGDRADERIRVTFNDGGTAEVSTFVRVQTPTNEADRLAFHQQFAGNENNIKAAVKAHMINCLKSTAPLMSASEHQSARKSEFSQVVEDQLRQGLYASRKVEKALKDRFDDLAQPFA